MNAALVYVEAVSGDLSGSGLAPTSISLGVGGSEIFGTTGRSGAGVVDRDYFAVTIPLGYEFVSMIELAGTTPVGGVSFLAIQTGTQVTVPPSTGSATGLLGWTHYGAVAFDYDLLRVLGMGGLGATDFVPPLPSGDYALWVQDTGIGSSSYGFSIVVALPEPGTATTLLVGLLALAVARVRSARG